MQGVTDMQIHHWDTKADGPLSEEALRQKLLDHGYHVARYVYAPRTFFPNHSHQVDKMDAVLSGRFRMTMGDESVVLEAGDWIFVPKVATHSAEVVGD